jgi:hypothetical protein
MKYDELVNSILTEQYFGGSPYEKATRLKTHLNLEEPEADNISGSEAKAMQDILNKSIEDQRGGKKKSALQMVDPNQLSPAGRNFLEKLFQSSELYKQGSKIGGNPELRGDVQADIEDEAVESTFGMVELDYIAWDKQEGFNGAHVYRYPPSGPGIVGLPHDKDGFRIDAAVASERDDIPGETLPLYPLDQFDYVNIFAKGSAQPIVTKGKITHG